MYALAYKGICSDRLVMAFALAQRFATWGPLTHEVPLRVLNAAFTAIAIPSHQSEIESMHDMLLMCFSIRGEKR